MIPLARTEKLIIQEVDDELVVYDREKNISHCLNRMAAIVWSFCNGQNTVEEIATLLEQELYISADDDVNMKELVELTLQELESFSLISEYLKQPNSSPIISLSKIIKTATIVSQFAIGSLFPAIQSVD
jgi:hypothetical protein